LLNEPTVAYHNKLLPFDINGKELFQEVLDCRLLLKDRQQKGSEFEHSARPKELLTFIDMVMTSFQN